MAKDPNYVNAYRGIARAEIALIRLAAAAPMPAFERPRHALETALKIDPGDAETPGQLADIDYVYDWDWPRAHVISLDGKTLTVKVNGPKADRLAQEG